MRRSVAMATFNGGRFLAEQLDSIVGQSRPPDELILSDDCSTDDTVGLAEAFAARAFFDLVIMRNEKRLGWADIFLRAINQCTGDVIALCDQEDVWHPDKLRVCARAFQVDPAASLVSHSAHVDESLRPAWSDPRKHIRKHARCSPGTLGPVRGLRAGFTMVFCCVFLRAPAVDTRPHSAPGDTARMSHDAWITFACGALGAVILLPEPLALYRRHPSTATESWSGHLTTPGVGDSTPVARIARRLRAATAGSLELRAQEKSYVERALSIQERAEYLETLRALARELGRTAPAGLDRTIQSHRHYARAMEARAAMYSSDRRARRAVPLARHTFRGDYTSSSKGGLGFASFVKDVSIGLVRG